MSLIVTCERAYHTFFQVRLSSHAVFVPIYPRVNGAFSLMSPPSAGDAKSCLLRPHKTWVNLQCKRRKLTQLAGLFRRCVNLLLLYVTSIIQYFKN